MVIKHTSTPENSRNPLMLSFEYRVSPLTSQSIRGPNQWSSSSGWHSASVRLRWLLLRYSFNTYSMRIVCGQFVQEVSSNGAFHAQTVYGWVCWRHPCDSGTNWRFEIQCLPETSSSLSSSWASQGWYSQSSQQCSLSKTTLTVK